MFLIFNLKVTDSKIKDFARAKAEENFWDLSSEKKFNSDSPCSGFHNDLHGRVSASDMYQDMNEFGYHLYINNISDLNIPVEMYDSVGFGFDEKLTIEIRDVDAKYSYCRYIFIRKTSESDNPNQIVKRRNFRILHEDMTAIDMNMDYDKKDKMNSGRHAYRACIGLTSIGGHNGIFVRRDFDFSDWFGCASEAAKLNIWQKNFINKYLNPAFSYNLVMSGVDVSPMPAARSMMSSKQIKKCFLKNAKLHS